jgi:hypothetical protein
MIPYLPSLTLSPKHVYLFPATKQLMQPKQPYYMLPMYFPIMDYPHPSYQTKTHTSWQPLSRNSVASSPYSITPVQLTIPKQMASLNDQILQKMEPGFSQTSIRITGATCYPCPICLQCLAKCHYQEGPLRTYHGTHTTHPSNLQGYHLHP